MHRSMKVAVGLGLGAMGVGPVVAPAFLNHPLTMPPLSDMALLGLGVAGVVVGWLASRLPAAEPEDRDITR